MPLGSLVVVVLSPFPQLWQRVAGCMAGQGHVVVGATTVGDARGRHIEPDVLAIDGQFLARCGWRGRELAETIFPERPAPVLGLVRHDAHRPPRTIDLTSAGVVALYEPFQPAELQLVVSWLGHRRRLAGGN